jgi:hypothetical protein
MPKTPKVTSKLLVHISFPDRHQHESAWTCEGPPSHSESRSCMQMPRGSASSFDGSPGFSLEKIPCRFYLGLVIALPASVPCRTTAYYLGELFSSQRVKLLESGGLRRRPTVRLSLLGRFLRLLQKILCSLYALLDSSPKTVALPLGPRTSLRP